MIEINKKIFLLAAVLFLCASQAFAHNDTSLYSPHKPELKPAPISQTGYNLAKAYWLGGAEIDLNFRGDDNKTRCNGMGYFQNPCRGNESKQQACPYDSQYYKCGCDKDVYKYDASTCPDNSTPGSNKCGELSDSCICNGKSEWSPDLNICEPRCSSNNDCGETQKCDPETRTCVNKTCNDISCTPAEICDSTTVQCVPDPDLCPADYQSSECDSEKQVQTGKQTLSTGRSCYKCRAKTCNDINCGDNQVCNSATLLCVNKAGCVEGRTTPCTEKEIEEKSPTTADNGDTCYHCRKKTCADIVCTINGTEIPEVLRPLYLCEEDTLTCRMKKCTDNPCEEGQICTDGFFGPSCKDYGCAEQLAEKGYAVNGNFKTNDTTVILKDTSVFSLKNDKKYITMKDLSGFSLCSYTGMPTLTVTAPLLAEVTYSGVTMTGIHLKFDGSKKVTLNNFNFKGVNSSNKAFLNSELIVMNGSSEFKDALITTGNISFPNGSTTYIKYSTLKTTELSATATGMNLQFIGSDITSTRSYIGIINGEKETVRGSNLIINTGSKWVMNDGDTVNMRDGAKLCISEDSYMQFYQPPGDVYKYRQPPRGEILDGEYWGIRVRNSKDETFNYKDPDPSDNLKWRRSGIYCDRSSQ